MYIEDTKYIIKLIDKLYRWCKFFKKSHNIVRWNDLEHEMRIELINNVDYVIENKDSLIINTNLKDDFDDFVEDIKHLIEDNYYNIVADNREKKVTLHIKLHDDFYKVIKSIIQMRVADLSINVYKTPGGQVIVESSFENGYVVIFELKFDDVFEVSIKRSDSNEYLDYSFAYVDSSELFGVIYKIEQAQKEALDNIDGNEILEKTGLSLKYRED